MSPSDENPAAGSRASSHEETNIYAPADSAARLVSVLDRYLADLQAGKNPDRAQLLADNPEIASELDDCLAGIEFVHRAARPTPDAPTQLGDFRIVREVGRGGMGVVYEAEQLSLKRKVALKVLRFGVSADADVMARFQREAETVAHLHHTNIVPIHAVGCDQGVNYYAMQFIEGRSLAAVLESFGGDNVVATTAHFREIAGWMLQAAEALAHAHQRGVIHRDIKPSNLILDPEGIVWLTDFGLAKRTDEVTLTAAGILMGTPRYMSPEQAAAARQPVDHRTDVYSLGATFYEVATRRPVFDSLTPQGVLTQILNDEPVAPRVLQGALPRDLETIILKCLAKEPGLRYQHARELVDDLRAYQDNRPIRARRATWRERAVRWARKHQRSSSVAAASAAASLLLLAGSWMGWQVYRESRLGRVLFTTDGPTLVAEVLNENGEPVPPGIPVPNPQPVALEAGSREIRFSGAGLLSEAWQINVAHGGPQTIPVKRVDQQLGPPLNITGPEAPHLIELDGQMHVVHRAERGWRLVRGETLQPVWPADLFKVPGPEEAARAPRSYVSGMANDLLQADTPQWYLSTCTAQAPGLASPAADLNGDSHQDLIFASRVSPSLVAVSGPTGQVLWWYRAAPQVPPGHDLASDPINPLTSAEDGGVLGQPALVTLNGEPVVIAFFVSISSHLRTKAGKEFLRPERLFFVEAVAARTGKRLWRSVFPLPEFATRQGQDFARLFPPKPVIRALAGREAILLHVGAKLFAWDLESGRECWPMHELGATAVQSAQFSDVDGDGEPEAIFVLFKDASKGGLMVRVVSLKTRKPLWEHVYRATQTFQETDWRPAGDELAWTVDLDGDGRGEVLVAVGDDWGRWGKHWYGLELLNGATGETRWQHRLRSMGNFSGSGMAVPVRVVVGPDLDGDRHAEVFVASASSPLGFDREPPTVQIEALSGKEGRIFWRQRRDLGGRHVSAQTEIMTPRWWQAGDDGGPLLVVPVRQAVGGQPVSHVYAAGTGQLVRTLPEVGDPQVADVNSDGIPDLWFVSTAPDARRMTVLKGAPPVIWRRPGLWEPAADFDGDGSVDFLELQNKQIAGRGGRDGRLLWQAQVARTGPQFATLDLNRDGVEDVVVIESQNRRRPSGKLGTMSFENAIVLVGFSGKTGERIWTSEDCDLINGSSMQTGGYPGEEYSIPMLGRRDLDGDDQPELIVAGFFPDVSLVAFANRDGALLWKLPVDQNSLRGHDVFERLFHDLNGDGVLDVVVSAPKTNDPYGNLTVAGLRAYSGRDGQPLWAEPPPDRVPIGAIMRLAHPVLGDLNGDGAPEVIVAAQEGKGVDPQTGVCRCELIVLDGRTGERQWSWPWLTDGQFHIWRPTLVNLDGDKTRCICFGIYEEPKHAPQIVLLDPAGGVRRKVPVGWVDFWSGVAARDLDGDARDELLFNSRNELQAYRERDQTILWKQPAISNWYWLVSSAAQAGAQKDVLTYLSQTGGAFGLEASTGAIKWRAESPRQENQTMRANLVAPATPAGRALLVSVDGRGESTLAQHAWPAEANGRYRSPPFQPVSYPDFDDPDRFRPLPWVPAHFPDFARLDSVERTDLGLSLLLMSVVLGRFLTWLWQRRWRLAVGYLLLLPLISFVIAAVALWVHSGQLEAHEQYRWTGWPWILVSGAMTLGSLTAAVWVLSRLGRLAWSLVRRKRARAAMLVTHAGPGP